MPLALILGILPALVWADPPGGGGGGSDGGGMRENPGDQIHIHSRSSENHKCPLCFERVYPEEATAGNLFGVSVCEEHGVLLHQKCAEEFGEGCPSCRGLTQRVETRSPGLLRQIHNDHVRDEAEIMARSIVERMNDRMKVSELQRHWRSAHEGLRIEAYLTLRNHWALRLSAQVQLYSILVGASLALWGVDILFNVPNYLRGIISGALFRAALAGTIGLVGIGIVAGFNSIVHKHFRSKLNRDFRKRVLAALERNHNIRLTHQELSEFIENSDTLPSSVSECLAREAAKQIDGMKE